MIKVLLTGGLGNQMFQYAFARNLAILNETELILNTAYLDSKLPYKKWATPMQYELNIFNIQAKVEKNIFKSKIFYPLAKLEYKIRDTINNYRFNVLIEKHHNFQPYDLLTPDNSYIKGNFQSERYFEYIQPIIREEFTFKNQLNEINKQLLNKIENTQAVSIHVRRGDYISLKQNQNKFYSTPISYFNRAIEYIATKISNPAYYVFSDDIEWAKENLKINFETHFIHSNNTPQTSYMDMQLMANCNHNIITNSTFSWWAAWLNKNPYKIVIAPKNWFIDNSINSQDIIPDEWIKL